MELLTLLLESDGSFIEKLVAGLVIYFVTRREVRKQFDETRKELKNITTALETFGAKILDLENKHDARITRLEVDVKDLKNVVHSNREA